VEARGDRSRRRQVQEIGVGRRQKDLRAEEVVTGRQNDRGGKVNGDYDLLAARWPLAVGSVIRSLIDAVHHGV
jgi:hypothetical protein